MTQFVTTTEMLTLEDYTMNDFDIPQEVLIERAAIAVQEVIGAGSFNLSHILVLVGLGNNGADGIALGRLLHQQGLSVSLQFVGNLNRAKASVHKQLEIAKHCGLHPSEKSDFKEATLIVDAIFGTGLNNPLPEGLQKMMKAANHIDNDVIAIDTPTGINPNTGEVMGAALKAHTTVALGYPKVGLRKNQGRKYCGDLVVKDIGVLTPDTFAFSL
ncbi:NAD(P)H-hydrate epimerase [Convivina praedatoris]|uniref:NAD(P)H-hydrate epimerase n=1 Tax=Convivina praedatoris TaxID=2880963 RepID=A0ABN8HDS1_9LACO|nr:NAD(P)H-hydrate epimerase [Convivina sp. LMG 32447]CAH1855486.1 Bifunctional NAD(P)H-hydrate repair enzyme Nnr [Convivina sp. LMG 32447]CAH1856216.1 Bifunctional NAD(P)H-hydrate repair enzyme Nnr [Convivina sp. LMG 32447]CAH1856533.1 Bifunctional NAD(P)H-hydrate repair enzyme Nnr [Convivina sp. LMG 32447]